MAQGQSWSMCPATERKKAGHPPGHAEVWKLQSLTLKPEYSVGLSPLWVELGGTQAPWVASLGTGSGQLRMFIVFKSLDTEMRLPRAISETLTRILNLLIILLGPKVDLAYFKRIIKGIC